MTCQRIRDIDLAAYIADPAISQWGEFRAHFPECEECSKAVAEWTALERSLEATGGSGKHHPDVEKLVALAEKPLSLVASERGELDRHLKACHRCADEVAAIRAFDFERLEKSAPLTPGRALRKVAQSLKELGSTLLGSEPGESRTGWLGEGIGSAPEPQLVFQSAEGVGDAKAREPGSALVAVLAARGGALEGEAFPILPGDTRLGRDPTCEVRLRGAEHTRLDAIIQTHGQRLEIISHDPRHPVLVNGEPAPSRSLADGDRLKIGPQQFELRLVTPEH